MTIHPIIDKIESQKVLRYEHRGARTISVIENVGIDRAGVRWRWLTDHWSEPQTNPDGYTTYLMFSGQDYGWQQL